MDQATQEPITVTQLVHDHHKIADLLDGSLPERVNQMLVDTAGDILKELADVKARNWLEFAAKVDLLINEMPASPTLNWLDKLRDSFAGDLLDMPWPIDKLVREVERPFSGARCPSFPNCSGGCGCGCEREMAQAAE